jgi:PTH2 family peptidyl-tRNA hydrolase
MAPGKAIAQAGHAFTDALLLGLESGCDHSHSYSRQRPGTKVTLGGPEWRLSQIYEDALRLNLPVVKIIDSGHIHPPHFDGSPVFTALGLGPVPSGLRFSTLRKLSCWTPQAFPPVSHKES